jgi:hypothetical protein
MATLLPGFAPLKKPKQEDMEPSVTKQAKPAPEFNEEILWNETAQNELPQAAKKSNRDMEEVPQQPDLLLDDLDSLFA